MLDRLQDAALAVLGVLAVAMIALAVRHEYAAAPSASAPLPVPPVPTGTAGEPSDEPTTGSSEEPAEEPGPPPAWRVGYREDGLLVRAPDVECDEDAAPVSVVTVAPGASVPAVVEVEGLVAVSGIAVDGAESASLVGSGPDCSAVGFTTSDGGATWVAADSPPAIWSLLPGEGRQVSTPAGAVDVPCKPEAVVGTDSQVARLACADGRLLGTSSTGEEWVPIGRVPDIEALVFVNPGDGFALAERESCDGVAVLATEDGGTSWDEVRCSPVEGPWGLAADGTSVMVLGADQVDASSDAGATWTRD